MRKRKVGLYRSLRNYFDRNDCLVRLSEDMKRPFVGSRVDDEPKVVLCFLLAQLRNIYESATILCRLGFPQPAYVLLRSLQEGCIRICYILHEGEREAIVERVSQKSPCNKKIVKDIHIRKGILGQTCLMRGILMNSRVWNHLSGLRHAGRGAGLFPFFRKISFKFRLRAGILEKRLWICWVLPCMGSLRKNCQFRILNSSLPENDGKLRMGLMTYPLVLRYGYVRHQFWSPMVRIYFLCCGSNMACGCELVEPLARA